MTITKFIEKRHPMELSYMVSQQVPQEKKKRRRGHRKAYMIIGTMAAAAYACALGVEYSLPAVYIAGLAYIGLLIFANITKKKAPRPGRV